MNILFPTERAMNKALLSNGHITTNTGGSYCCNTHVIVGLIFVSFVKLGDDLLINGDRTPIHVKYTQQAPQEEPYDKISHSDDTPTVLLEDTQDN